MLPKQKLHKDLLTGRSGNSKEPYAPALVTGVQGKIFPMASTAVHFANSSVNSGIVLILPDIVKCEVLILNDLFISLLKIMG
jgi:hypothetical protein